MPESSGPQARLEVVGDPPAGEEAAVAAEIPAASAPGETRVSRRSFRLLIALLLLAALALVVQTRRVSQLEGRVVGLGSELTVARQQIDSYEGQLGQVRGLVDDLGARLDELRALLQPAAAQGPEEAL